MGAENRAPFTHGRADKDPLSHGVLIPIRRDSSPYFKGSQVAATDFHSVGAEGAAAGATDLEVTTVSLRLPLCR